jgi:hypothetical protein
MFDTHDATEQGLSASILGGDTTFGCWPTLASSITAGLIDAARTHCRVTS